MRDAENAYPLHYKHEGCRLNACPESAKVCEIAGKCDHTNYESKDHLCSVTSTGRLPKCVELKAMSHHYRRFWYSRTESITYPNGWRVDCLWPDDGTSEAKAHFDKKKHEIV